MRHFLCFSFSRFRLKYSIIIPTLNEGKLLSELLIQLNKFNNEKSYDTEIIISDGGSTDETLEIALKYADKIVVHTSESKQNIAMGRNSGADYADANILLFFNGDVTFKDVYSFFDYIEKHFISNNYLAMTCKVKVFRDEEIFADKVFHSVYNAYFHLLNIVGIGMGRGECHIVRKNIFKEVNGYNEKLAAGEDFDLFKRIREKGKILFASDLCVYESPRRYRKYGYWNVTWKWMQNAISVFFKNRSISQSWDEVR